MTEDVLVTRINKLYGQRRALLNELAVSFMEGREREALVARLHEMERESEALYAELRKARIGIFRQPLPRSATPSHRDTLVRLQQRPRYNLLSVLRGA